MAVVSGRDGSPLVNSYSMASGPRFGDCDLFILPVERNIGRTPTGPDVKNPLHTRPAGMGDSDNQAGRHPTGWPNLVSARRQSRGTCEGLQLLRSSSRN